MHHIAPNPNPNPNPKPNLNRSSSNPILKREPTQPEPRAEAGFHYVSVTIAERVFTRIAVCHHLPIPLSERTDMEPTSIFAALNFVSRFFSRRPTVSHHPVIRYLNTGFKEKVVVNNLRDHPIEVLSVKLEIEGVEHRQTVGETILPRQSLSVELNFSQKHLEDGATYPTKVSACIQEATRGKPTEISCKGRFLMDEQNRRHQRRFVTVLD